MATRVNALGKDIWDGSVNPTSRGAVISLETDLKIGSQMMAVGTGL